MFRIPTVEDLRHIPTLDFDHSHDEQTFQSRLLQIKDNLRQRIFVPQILASEELFYGKNVLEIGTGTGAQALAAVKAGARRVVAIDHLNEINHAGKMVMDNRLSNVISVIQGNVNDIRMPNDIDKFDIIISDWMSTAHYHQKYLNETIYARDRYLSRDGVVWPEQITLNIVGISDTMTSLYPYFWKDLLNYDMMHLTRIADSVISLVLVNDGNVLTEHWPIKYYDMRIQTANDNEYQTQFPFRCIKSGILRGFGFYFGVQFPNKGDVTRLCQYHANNWHCFQSLHKLRINPFYVEQDSSLNFGVSFTQHPHHMWDKVAKIEFQYQNRTPVINYRDYFDFL